MDNMDNELEQFIAASKSVSLTPEEKKSLGERISAHARAHPPGNGFPYIAGATSLVVIAAVSGFLLIGDGHEKSVNPEANTETSLENTGSETSGVSSTELESVVPGTNENTANGTLTVPASRATSTATNVPTATSTTGRESTQSGSSDTSTDTLQPTGTGNQSGTTGTY